jgi:transposase
MKIKRQLPPAPKITTKTVRNDTMRGYGVYTYESPVPHTVMDLQIPPTRSDSQAAERERELKAILDLAREGKTASEIEAETGFPRRRVTLTVMKFAEYGAKLAPEPKKHKPTAPANQRTGTKWTDEMIDQLIELHRAGLTFSQIGREMGLTKSSITSKVRILVEDGILEPRVEQMAWTAEDMERLMRLREQGKTWGEIADVFGRKITACHMAYKREMERRKR